jgi:hypothetical protein
LCRFALAHAPVVRTVRSRHSPPRANSPCPDAGEPEVEVRRNAEEMIASSASARSAVNPEVAGSSPVEPAIKWPWGVFQHYVDHRVDCPPPVSIVAPSVHVAGRGCHSLLDDRLLTQREVVQA